MKLYPFPAADLPDIILWFHFFLNEVLSLFQNLTTYQHPAPPSSQLAFQPPPSAGPPHLMRHMERKQSVGGGEDTWACKL